LGELNVEDIVNFMLAYEAETEEARLHLASILKLRANEFISHINIPQNYFDLIRSIH